jgi:hypothetical protein
MVGKRAAKQEAGIYEKSDEAEYRYHPMHLTADFQEIEQTEEHSIQQVLRTRFADDADYH